MKIGLYGGAFNPIHNGHLHLAGCAARELKLGMVVIIPCFKYPGNKDLEHNVQHRQNMLKECDEHSKLWLSDVEIRRKGISYTIDTIKELNNNLGEDYYCLILGPDNEDISWWREGEEIKSLIDVKVAGKDFDMIPLPIRSSNIRERIKNNQSITGLVPLSVEKYIQENGLYK